MGASVTRLTQRRLGVTVVSPGASIETPVCYRPCPRVLTWFLHYSKLYAGYVQLMVGMATTIQIRPATRERLASLKSSPRETYDDLLNKLLALVPRGDDEGPYTDAFRIGLLNARLDVRAGRVSAHAAIKKRMGL